MGHENGLLNIPYEYSGGPLSMHALAYDMMSGGPTNCQGAVQLFYNRIFHITLPPYSVLPAESFKQTGYVVSEAGGDDFFAPLKFGDIIYADPNYDRTFIPLGLSREEMLHMAIFVGKAGDPRVLKYFPQADQFELNDVLIYHSTVLTGESTLWKVPTFVDHYLPVRAKRIQENLRESM